MKKNFANSLFYPLAIVSTLFFILFAIIAYGIIEKGVKNSITQNLNTSVDLFTDSIRENIIMGAESEVFRKCKAFSKNESLKSITISDYSGRIICETDNSISGRTFTKSKTVFYDEDQKEAAAVVAMTFADDISSDLLLKSILVLLGTLVILIATYIFIAQLLIKTNIKSVIHLANLLSDGNIASLKDVSNTLPPSTVEELRALYTGVENQAKKVEMYQTELVDAAKWKAANELSSLVAHDIKSPLSNIEMIADDEENDPTLRLMLKNSVTRIYELINEVMSPSKLNAASNINDKCVAFLLPIIEDAVAVTTYALKSNSSIAIQLHHKKADHSDVIISPNEFKRAISNVLKNSIEAVSSSNGKIDVYLYDDAHSVYVAIKDNGKGISSDKVALLGSKGVTIGKQGGTGYGLFQVKEMLRAAGGFLEIESGTDRGMQVTMKIPKYDAHIRVKDLQVSPAQPIVIVDDEDVTYKRWKKAFAKVKALNLIYYFQNSNDYEKWAAANPPLLTSAIGLFDYDLKGSTSGLDLLRTYPLARKILVTGDNKNLSVLKNCRENNFGLIAKENFPQISLADESHRQEPLFSVQTGI